MSLSDNLKTKIKLDNGDWLVLTQETKDNLNIVVLTRESTEKLVEFLKTNNLIN